MTIRLKEATQEKGAEKGVEKGVQKGEEESGQHGGGMGMVAQAAHAKGGEKGRLQNGGGKSALAPLVIDETKHTLSLGPSETVEVTFAMRAVAMGEATLEVSASLLPGPGPGPTLSTPTAADKLELKISIHGQQPPVAVATSRALVAAAQPSIWREGIALPRAVPGSGHLSVSFGVGRLPAVESIGSSLLRQASVSPTPDYASPYLGLLTTLAALLPYAHALQSAPHTDAAALLSATRAAMPRAAAALSALSNGYGLHSSPSAQRGAAFPVYPICFSLLSVSSLPLLAAVLFVIVILFYYI